VQGGKDSKLRLINLHDLSGKGGPRHVGGELSITPLPQGGVILARPAAWLAPDGTTWLFVATHHGLSGLALVVDDNGKPWLEPRWTNSTDGATPVVVAGVLYMARNHELMAIDPETGAPLWSDASLGTIHWQSPIVVNGRIYVCDNEGHVFAYAVR
jgi:outer membrane protein assembly factor BamB